MTRNYRFLTGLLIAGALAAGLVPRTAVAQAPGSLLIVPKKTDPNQLISFSFQQADIDDVLRFLADASGKMVFKDASVQTTLTIRNQSRIKVDEAIKLVALVLSYKGYSLEDKPDMIVVQTKAASRSEPGKGPVSIGKELDTIPAGPQMITHIFPLQTLDALRLKDELQPLFGTDLTTLIADGDTNTLIVNDTGDNVRGMAQLINALDKPQTDEITLEVVHLKYADATDVARYLTDLFQQPTTQQGGGGGGGGGFPGGGFGGFPGGAAPPAGGGASGARSSLAQLRGRVKFAADQRSNNLIIYASPANIKAVKDILADIDVNLQSRTEYRIVVLQYADATAMADQLNQLISPGSSSSSSGNNQNRNRGFGGGGGFGGFFGGGGNGATTTNPGDYNVVADVRTNALIVQAPVDAIQKIVDLIADLDVPSQVKDVVRIFQLQNAIASETATTIRNLLLGNNTGTTGGLNTLFGAGNRTSIQPGSPLDLLRQVTIIPNDQTNQLLVSGPAQTFPVIEEILRTDTGLDRKLPQVFIEVVIADVTLDQTDKYGVEWNALSGTSTAATNFGLNLPTTDTTGFRYTVLSKNIQATVQALTTQNKVKVISTPHVMVTDNSPALITIGESIPYAGSTTISSGLAQTSVDFENVAITLNVTPHISPGNNVLMDIDQVVNSLIAFITVSPGQQAPETTNRRAGTTVTVGDNQTVVLGGIISDNDNRTINKVPVLGSIPLIGNLFKSTSVEKTRTELVVFLTPHIVRETKDADPIRTYEEGRLRVNPLRSPTMIAPFSKPLDILPEDLRKRVPPTR